MEESSENFEAASESRPEREMFKATCSDCGAECEVPFEPTEGKPVRCLDCFKKNRPKKSFGRRNFNRGPREMHDAKCAECGKDCQVPFKPNGEKPVLCGDCYKKSKGFD
jgi:CxxC-x17-CxxC domain-containing protein